MFYDGQSWGLNQYYYSDIPLKRQIKACLKVRRKLLLASPDRVIERVKGWAQSEIDCSRVLSSAKQFWNTLTLNIHFKLLFKREKRNHECICTEWRSYLTLLKIDVLEVKLFLYRCLLRECVIRHTLLFHKCTI